MASLWNEQCPEKFRVDSDVLRLNTIESPVFDWGASSLEIDPDGKLLGYVLVKKSAASLYAGPDEDSAHLSAVVFRDCLTGVDMLARTKRLLRARGVYRLVFGQDSRHFFPGCPDECHTLRDFLMVEGFDEGGEQFDLTHDLADYEPPTGVELIPEQGPVAMRRATLRDVAAVDEFLARSFPGRWRYDTMNKVEKEGRADFLNLLWVDGRVQGFAILQDAGHKVPIAGAVWRRGLGENWCTLGPIGVSNDVRGRGLGDALLANSLVSMKALGKRNCLIDWTGLVKWYGKHGFSPTNRYKTFTLRLDS